MERKAMVMKEIDAAIDAMDQGRIEEGMRELERLESSPIQPEDPAVFAARVQKLNKERVIVKKKFRFIPAAVAAAVLIMGGAAYAASKLNALTFEKDGNFVTVRSSGELTEEQVKEMISITADDSGNVSLEMTAGDVDPEMISAAKENFVQPEIETLSYGSVEEAEEGMDMIIPVPPALPGMTLDSASGQTVYYGDGSEKRTVWLNYSDAEGRMFAITESRTLIEPGSGATMVSTSPMDEGSGGTYVSASGAEYQTLTESDETGEKTAYLAVACVGEYEYVLGFAGFDETQREEIIDSVDLTVLNK